MTTSLYIRTLSRFKFIRLYMWNITGCNFYLIVLACKNITCRLENKSKEIHLYAFIIHLNFLTSSSKIVKIWTPKKNYLGFGVKWLLYNRFIHFPEAESGSFLVLSFQCNRGCKSWWEHLSFEKGTVKIDKKIFSETI